MRGWFNRLFGDRGERLAARLLKKSGLTIVTRNFTNRFGEIDIIALDGETIVFVEVKSRRSNAAGEPEEAVDPTKQQQILKTASAYLQSRKLNDQPVRFDVVGIIWGDEKTPEVRHHRHAFTA